MHHLQGLIAAPFTPMFEQGNLNVSIIPSYYQLLKSNGVIGAFINGSTGEGPSLTMDEQMRQTEAWADATKHDPDFKVISLVGGTSLESCKHLANHAYENGLYAVAMLGPYYFKPATVQALVHSVVEVASEVRTMPFYYYHIPILTGVHFSMVSFLKEIDGKLPNFAGIKYTHEDFMDFQSCLEYNNRKYDMLWGRDENYIAALAVGTKGVVGSTYNYASKLYHKISAAFEKGDMELARKYQMQSIQIVNILGKYGGSSTGKAFMKLIGLDCGKFRLPVGNMSDQDYELFIQDVKAIGFDSYKSKLPDSVYS